MESVYTYEKVLDVLQAVPFVTKQQLFTFLADEIGQTQLDHCISDLLKDNRLKHKVVYDYHLLAAYQRWTFRNAEATDDFISAFWIIANMGAKEVRFLYEGEGPTRLWFQTETDRSICDITVAQTEETMRLAYLLRKRMSYPIDYEGYKNMPNEDAPEDKVMKKIVDDIIHIIVLPNYETAVELKDQIIEYGFDEVFTVEPRTGEIEHLDVDTL